MTLKGNTNVGGGGGVSSWGSITGTLANQTDLADEIARIDADIAAIVVDGVSGIADVPGLQTELDNINADIAAISAPAFSAITGAVADNAALVTEFATKADQTSVDTLQASVEALEFDIADFQDGANVIDGASGLAIPVGAGSTAMNTIGISHATVGTATAETIALTSAFTAMKRMSSVSSAAANASCALTCNNKPVTISTTSDVGDWRLVVTGGSADALTGCRMLIGVTPSSPSGALNPSAMTDFIALCADDDETQLSLKSRGAAGTVTEIALTGDWPANTNEANMYRVEMTHTAGAVPTVRVVLTNLISGLTQTVTLNGTDHNLPTAGTYLGPMAWRSTGANTTAVKICSIGYALGQFCSLIAYGNAVADTGATLGADNTYTARQVVAPSTVTAASNIFTPDASASNTFKITLGATNTIANPSNMSKDGQPITVILKQDATGNRTVTWGTKWFFPGDVAPTLSTAANAIDVVSGIYDSGSDSIICSLGNWGAP